MDTNRRSFAQLMLCRGCCCGVTERGFAPVPVELIKTRWKELKLNRYIQLTISGCLGPCDVSNVALILTPGGQIWLGGLTHEYQYEALIHWAQDCGEHQMFMPLPEVLADRKLSRWPGSLNLS